MRFQNALNFISDNESTNRLARRTNWYGSRQIPLVMQKQLDPETNGAVCKEKLLEAMAEPSTHREFLSQAAETFFENLDTVMKFTPQTKKEFAGVSMVTLYNPDYVVYATDDSEHLRTYVSVLVDDKIFTVNRDKSYEISGLNKQGRLHYFIGDKDEETFELNQLMPTLDEMDSMERLSGEKLRKQAPELFSHLKQLASSFPEQIRVIESEFAYMIVKPDAAQTLAKIAGQDLTTSARYLALQGPASAEELGSLLADGKMHTSRVRFNFNEKGDVETLNLLLTPSEKSLLKILPSENSSATFVNWDFRVDGA